MNIVYLIGLLLAIFFTLFGITVDLTATPPIDFEKLGNFVDVPSLLIVVCGTLAVVIACYPKLAKSFPAHMKIMLRAKAFDPDIYVEKLTELAQIARKNGLLALEEKANEQTDPFFKQAIMLIVDAYDQDKVRSILEYDIECMSARHEDAAAMYDKASSVAPAFGMVGTLVGLINMLKGMSLDGDGASNIGSDMGTALITTLYGCILAHMVFGPIATLLRNRDQEEVLCKMIIVEGIMSIQSGENPKSLREKLLTFVDQNQRGENAGGKKGKAPKEKKK